MSGKYRDLLSRDDYRDLSAQIRARLAFSLVDSGKTSEAMALLVQCAGEESQDLQRIHFYLGVCNMAQHNAAASEASFLRALDGCDTALIADAHYRLGFLDFERARYSSAKFHFEQALVVSAHPPFVSEHVHEMLERIAVATKVQRG